MSGFFDLTATKAAFYYRRNDVPETVTDGCSGMHLYAAILRWAGLEVVQVNSTWLRVCGTQGDVWTALSGKPADLGHYEPKGKLAS